MQNIFTSVLQPSQILSSDADKKHYGKDWLKCFTAAPSLILLPSSESEVQAIIKICNVQKIVIVPSGGRTGLSGGATATQGEVIVSLEKMNKVIEVNELDRTITAQAGVITQKIQDAAAAHNLYFPVEFTTKGSSHIGGNVATNAGGIRVVKYGHTRDWVVGMKVVTGKGDILELNGALFKNNTGYDLRAIFMGSEGTLGIITEITLRLIARPFERVRMLVALNDINGVLPLFKEARSAFSSLSAFEYFAENGLSRVLAHNALTRPFAKIYPNYVLVEVEIEKADEREKLEEFFTAQIENGKIEDVVISQTQKQAEELIELRERIGETLSTHYFPHKNDLSVPVPMIPKFVSALHNLVEKEYPGFEVVIFGHIGDGNLHVNVLKPPSLPADQFFTFCHEADRKIFALVQEFKGSISAEHGIGLLKKDFLHFSRSSAEIGYMKEIKKIFDPNLILNRGKIFDL